MNIEFYLEDLLAEVNRVNSFARDKLRNATSGSLYIKNIGGVRYLRRDKGDTTGKYLSKNETSQIMELEEKAYYTELLRVSEQETKVLEKTKSILENRPNCQSVFLSIPPERRHLIEPYEPEALEEVMRAFIKKEVKSNLYSQNGDKVRSKSELIIADRLKAAGVPYYYEDPLIMPKEDCAITECLYWHPDFRVQNKRTGKQFYWEHFGMMDDKNYCSQCIEKLEIYAEYGYYPGENLIITSESSLHSLNLEYVDRIIKKYLI